MADEERGLGKEHLTAEPEALELMAQAADGDGRRALNMLELGAGLVEASPEALAAGRCLNMAIAKEVASGGRRRFDKGGDQFYDQISALHKAVRGTDPDAALYWLCRMLDGGCDPLYIARRVVRMAVEDIGLADPRAFPMTLDAWEAYDRLGSPEGELAIANAVVYLACAPKSNAVYVAMAEARSRRREVRHAGCAAAFPECPDQFDEESRLRARLSLRARRAGRVRGRRALFAGRDAGSAILPPRFPGTRIENWRSVGPLAVQAALERLN